MPWIAFGAALAAGLLLIPVVRRLSIRWGKVARPREDRWHSRPTATLGGIGIFLGFGAGMLVALLASGNWGVSHWGMLAGSILIFALGVYDDFKRISPPAKLAGQFLAAAAVVALGYTTNFFTPRIDNPLLAQLPNILLTFFWLIGITNAINLLDNMDGLAGGISCITALFLSFFFWQSGNQGLLLISMALAGSLVAFLVFNFPPASIFMGDSGSLFLGFTLALLAIVRHPNASNVFAVMGVPTLLFLLPIMDTTLVTITRLLRGQSPAQGGRDHTSHRLIAFGLNERQAVLVLYGVAILSGVMAFGLERLEYWFSLVIMPILVVSLTLLVAYLGGLKVSVPSAPPSAQEKPITRIMLELTFKRRLLEVLLDFFLIGVAYYLSFLVRFGFALGDATLGLFLQSFPVTLGFTYLAYFAFGVYRGVWRYVSVDDLIRYSRAALAAAVLAGAADRLFYPSQSYPVEIFILYAILLFLGFAASRSSFKVFDLVAGTQLKAQEERVLIYGAGDPAEMALRWIRMNPQLGLRPVGILDDDPYLAGRQIHGIEVLGLPAQAEAFINRRQVDGIILARSGDHTEGYYQVVEIARQQGCWLRSLRLDFEEVEA